ncbi:MAG: sigma-70 family RNA polymerase sigma factor [Mariniblastus sp.]|nr:sigma-70 family RNA polymerase sigma factor [Mariniblastus sp.]
MSSSFKTNQNALNSDPDTQMSLIEQAKNDLPSAWEIVYTLYAPLIRRWARSFGVTCPYELENIVQDVFTKIAKNLKQYQDRATGGSFRGWLRVITRNHIFTNRLGNSKLRTIGGSDWHQRLSEIPFNNKSLTSLLDTTNNDHTEETSVIFRNIVNWVDKRYQKQKRQKIVFRRVILEEQAPSEVAKELNVSVNVVYQLKSRILAQIREVFKDVI